MLFEHIGTNGRSFAKDPCVVKFGGMYYMYYSTVVRDERLEIHSYAIGVAVSADLDHWEKKTILTAEQPAEGAGIAAPGAIVRDGVVHLFYQSYGQFPKDYICHATSADGVRFRRDASNPVFCPTGTWNIGRAIDADVCAFGGELMLYWATRDPAGEVQQLGVSSAPLDSDYSAPYWKQRCDDAILKPELPWEQVCIEAPATYVWEGKIYMMYGGAYNCCPQQIGCAVSADGVHFERVSDEPFLRPGTRGSWNASESGHPYVFVDDGRIHLFYQGSDDGGDTWRLSRCEIRMEGGKPAVVA